MCFPLRQLKFSDATPRYAHGKKTLRRKLGIKRHRKEKPLVKGLASAWTAKVRLHWKRLHGAKRMEGLWAWRDTATALLHSKIPMQTGTLPCERLWASMLDMLPSSCRCMTERYFVIVSQIVFLRHNLRRFAGGYLPPWAREDSLLAQRLDQIEATTRALAEGGTILDLIFERFD